MIFSSVGQTPQKSDLALLVCKLQTFGLKLLFIAQGVMPESVRLEVTAENDVRMVIVVESDNGLCSICLENVQEGRQTLPCGHEFHDECLSEWLVSQDTCPVCRATFPLLKIASTIRPLEEPSITIYKMMKFFFLKSVMLMITFVNYYSLRYIIDQSNAFYHPFHCIVVVTLGAMDIVTLYFTVRKT